MSQTKSQQKSSRKFAKHIMHTADSYYNSYVNAQLLAHIQTYLLNTFSRSVDQNNSSVLRRLVTYFDALVDPVTNTDFERLIKLKRELLDELVRHPNLLAVFNTWPRILCHESGYSTPPLFQLHPQLPSGLVTLFPTNNSNNTLITVTSLDTPSNQLFADTASQPEPESQLPAMLALVELVNNPVFATDQTDIVPHLEYLWNNYVHPNVSPLVDLLNARVKTIKTGHCDGTLSDAEQLALTKTLTDCQHVRTHVNFNTLYNSLFQNKLARGYYDDTEFVELAKKSLASYTRWSTLAFQDVLSVYFSTVYESTSQIRGMPAKSCPTSIRNFYAQLQQTHAALSTQFKVRNIPQLEIELQSLMSSIPYVADKLLTRACILFHERCWKPMLDVHRRAAEWLCKYVADSIVAPYRQQTSALAVLQRCKGADWKFDEPLASVILISLDAVLPLARNKTSHVDLNSMMLSTRNKIWLALDTRQHTDLLKWDASVASPMAQGVYSYMPGRDEVVKVNMLLNRCVWPLVRQLTATGELSEQLVETFKESLLLDMSMFLSLDVYIHNYMRTIAVLAEDEKEHMLRYQDVFPKDVRALDDEAEPRYLDINSVSVGYYYVTSRVSLGGRTTETQQTFWTEIK